MTPHKAEDYVDPLKYFEMNKEAKKIAELAINHIKGKPKTHQEWASRFNEVVDLAKVIESEAKALEPTKDF